MGPALHRGMANLTITVDEQVLRRARIRALQRDASVNRHRAETLEWYAQGAVQDAVDEIIDGLDRPGGRRRVAFFCRTPVR